MAVIFTAAISQAQFSIIRYSSAFQMGILQFMVNFRYHKYNGLLFFERAP